LSKPLTEINNQQEISPSVLKLSMIELAFSISKERQKKFFCLKLY